MKFLALLFAMIASAAFAAPDYGRIDLIDGGRVDDKQLIGLRIDLNEAEGWKTYWRISGQNGLSPVFNFEGSENIAEVKQYWPEPHLIGGEGVEAFGYSEDLTVVFEIMPQNSEAPVKLDMTVDLGVCQNICIPAHEEFKQVLNSGYSIDGAGLQVAMTNSFDVTPRENSAFDAKFYLFDEKIYSAEDWAIVDWKAPPCETGEVFAANEGGAIIVC